MFTKEDFELESTSEVFTFLALVAPFVGLVTPFVLLAYTVGFILNITGKLES